MKTQNLAGMDFGQNQVSGTPFGNPEGKAGNLLMYFCWGSFQQKKPSLQLSQFKTVRVPYTMSFDAIMPDVGSNFRTMLKHFTHQDVHSTPSESRGYGWIIENLLQTSSERSFSQLMEDKKNHRLSIRKRQSGFFSDVVNHDESKDQIWSPY